MFASARAPMRAAIACSRNRSPPGRRQRTQAPRTAVLAIGLPSADRTPWLRAMREAGTRATAKSPACRKRLSRLRTSSPPGRNEWMSCGGGGEAETTASTSHSCTLYRRWIGDSRSHRTKAEIGAPRRSALNSGKLWTQKPLRASASARSCEARTTPWPPLPAITISFIRTPDSGAGTFVCARHGNRLAPPAIPASGAPLIGRQDIRGLRRSPDGDRASRCGRLDDPGRSGEALRAARRVRGDDPENTLTSRLRPLQVGAR